MRITLGKLSIAAVLVAATATLCGCGLANTLENLANGGNGNGNGNGTGTDVVYSFSGNAMPLAAAQQIGSGNWSTASVTDGQLTVTIPDGTSNYAIAYVCPTWQGMGPVNQEFVIEASVADGTAFNLSCFQNPASGTATGSADGTAIAGTTNLRIVGAYGLGAYLGTPSGSFSSAFADGTNDVAVVAEDASSNVLGVKIVRSQAVPGAINGNTSIALAPSDETTQQSITVTNIPSGFSSPAAVGADYWTANNTDFSLMNGTNTTQYATVASSEVATGDYYFFTANASNGTNQTLYVVATAPSPGPVVLEMPAPLPYSAPTPVAQPTFTVNYSAFSQAKVSGDYVTLQWFINSTTLDFISVYATSNFLNGSATVAVPDLTSLKDFFQPAKSGTTVDWAAYAYGGSYPWYTPTPSSGSISAAGAHGQYTEP